jgi:protein-disulfide isomerase
MSDDILTKKERKLRKKQERLEREAMEAKKGSMNRIIKWLVVAAVIAGGAYYAYSRYTPVPQELVNRPVDAILENDWVRGNPEAEVVLVEYSDFQCPACKAYQPMVEEIMEAYGDEVALVFRHFPLKQIHLQAVLAAQAAEAAGRQGKFWEMHDVLFEKQSEWAENRRVRTLFNEYAESLGLNLQQFRQDMGSQEVRQRVEADYLHSLANRLNATPSFILNGEKIQNPESPAAFMALIEGALGIEASPSAEMGEVIEVIDLDVSGQVED